MLKGTQEKRNGCTSKHSVSPSLPPPPNPAITSPTFFSERRGGGGGERDCTVMESRIQMRPGARRAEREKEMQGTGEDVGGGLYV